MARITVEDCLKRIPNRFNLVHAAAGRVRQIREGSEYLVSAPKNEDIVIALREIAAGEVYLKKETEPEEIQQTKAPEEIAEAEEAAEAAEAKQPSGSEES